jgi:hypothetical protein
MYLFSSRISLLWREKYALSLCLGANAERINNLASSNKSFDAHQIIGIFGAELSIICEDFHGRPTLSSPSLIRCN